MINKIRALRLIGISEGISFLVLLLIAMPLKYYFDFPLAVRWVGLAHGVLFIAYVAMVLISIRLMKWTWLQVGINLAASLLPFGTFFLDKSWREREQEVVK